MNKHFYITSIIILISFITGCEKEVSVSPPLEAAAEGKIYFDSDPQGAEIFINGDNTGKFTPDSIIHLEDGVYKTMFRYSPYLDIYDSLEVTSNTPAYISKSFYDDFRNFGSIECISYPSGCYISINDSLTSHITPFTIGPIWPGNYKITLSYPEFRDLTKYISIRGGQERSVNFFPQDTSQCVDYNPSNSKFPSIQTMCVEIDKDNFKWIGLPGTGLVKFNEETITKYTTYNSSIPHNYVNCISIDELDKIWVGTQNGLLIIDGENWTVFSSGNTEMKNDYINDIEFDNLGNAWMSASDPVGGRYLLKFDGTEWTSYNAPADRLILSLAIDKEERVWAALDRGVRIFVDETWILPNDYYTSDPMIKTYSAEAIACDEQGNIWLGMGHSQTGVGDLFVYDGTTFNIFPLPEKVISHIYISPSGNKWISCLGRTPTFNLSSSRTILIKIDTEDNITPYSMGSTKMASGLLRWSSAQSNGDLWIASRDKGIIKFKNADL